MVVSSKNNIQPKCFDHNLIRQNIEKFLGKKVKINTFSNNKKLQNIYDGFVISVSRELFTVSIKCGVCFIKKSYTFTDYFTGLVTIELNN